MVVKHKKQILWIAAVLLAGGLLLWNYQRNRQSGPPQHIIVISIDTCRADYLSCYGYPRKTTPNIDQLAADGILFEHAVAPVPITLPSHSTMLTGTIPPYHQVHGNLDYYLAEDNITLAEILRDDGYKTAGFVSTFVLDPQFGIAQGFEVYDADCEVDAGADMFVERRAERTTELAAQWLRENKDEKVFLFAHYYDPHTPLVPPEPFKSRFGSSNPKDLYAAEIAYADHYIGKLLDTLKSLGIYDNALIIFAGDHGESVGEHGESEHGYYIYESTIHVPMIIKTPGNPRTARVKSIAGLVDIVPTVCAMAGIEIPASVSGQDLGPHLRENHTPVQQRYLYSESLSACSIQCNPLQGITSDNWKYIRTTREELYDLKNDPKELQNLASAEPKRVRMMRKHLEAILADNLRTSDSESTAVLNDETLKRLASLGYVAGGVPTEIAMTFDRTKPDPKDFLEYFVLKSDVEQHIMANRQEEAKQGITTLLEQYPDMAQTHFLRGQYALRTGDMEAALKAYKRCLKINPDDWRGYMQAGRASLELKKYEDAAALLQHSLRLKSDTAEVRRLLGTAYNELKQYQKAAEQLEKAIAHMPDDSQTRHWLATVYMVQGNTAAAVKEWKEALRIRPDWPEVLNNVAWLLAARPNAVYADAPKALELAQKACELTNQTHAGYLDTLAMVYAANGNFTKAVAAAEKACQIAQHEGQADFAQRIRKRQNLYRLKRTYRE